MPSIPVLSAATVCCEWKRKGHLHCVRTRNECQLLRWPQSLHVATPRSVHLQTVWKSRRPSLTATRLRASRAHRSAACRKRVFCFALDDEHRLRTLLPLLVNTTQTGHGHQQRLGMQADSDAKSLQPQRLSGRTLAALLNDEECLWPVSLGLRWNQQLFLFSQVALAHIRIMCVAMAAGAEALSGRHDLGRHCGIAADAHAAAQLKGGLPQVQRLCAHVGGCAAARAHAHAHARARMQVQAVQAEASCPAGAKAI
eukprot:366463-Chlamydomonas_euryale.AAC.6